ncbi:helix-turn-helix transcriptional regulator [uncultured Clostridium sp.]|uniref:helix-turn-helix transcriptional regulator n=1 Tax=uncultured Clostridium sp. TaxID=59620 RepID=UPI0025F36FF2|nr:helix-turn-helix transcriptional regulator [uncultured Clostridium sp.]
MNKLMEFKNLDEFESNGFVLLYNNIVNNTIENNLQKILIAKRITISELSRRTGVSKQVISSSIVKNTKIGLDSAIKISHVLETPIEEIFKLNHNAWVDVYLVDGKTVYLKMDNLKMLNSIEKNKYIQKYCVSYYSQINIKYSDKKLNDNYTELFVQVGRRIKTI